MITRINPLYFSVGIIHYAKTRTRVNALKECIRRVREHVHYGLNWEMVVSIEDDSPLKEEASDICYHNHCRVVYHRNRANWGHNFQHLDYCLHSRYRMMLTDDIWLTHNYDVSEAVSVFTQDSRAAAVLLQEEHCSGYIEREHTGLLSPALERKYRNLSPHSTFFYTDVAHIRSSVFNEEIGGHKSNMDFWPEVWLNQDAKTAALEDRARIYCSNKSYAVHTRPPSVLPFR